MKALIMNYRGTHKHIYNKHMILKPDGCSKKEDAQKFVGKKVVWTTSSGKKLTGVIAATHGRNGAVRAIFEEKGLPGQSLGTKLDIE